MIRLRFILLLLLFSAPAAQAENMIMLRVGHSFDDTMILMKDKLNEYGYKIAHIQKCDGGLSDFGYKTGFYKSIFFGKFDEMRHLTSTHPDIIPYVPLKIAVMEEKDTILLVAMNPTVLRDFFEQPELRTLFGRWESDIRAIFREIGESQKLG